MASRKEVNRYYPPDWDPSKGSLNSYHGESWRNGSATVNGRAGAAKGIEIIRFETPWNMWCTTCNKMIGRGVRYNAEKKKVGKYYTTTLLSFTMKCHMCDGTIVIETDPKNDDYKITEGGKRKAETWAPKEAGTMELMSDDTKKQIEQDPMYKLEHVEGDKKKALTAKTAIALMLEMPSVTDYDINASLRSTFRKKRKQLKVQGIKDGDLLVRSSLEMSAVSLVPEDPRDKALASRVRFGANKFESLAAKKKAVKQSSIFAPSGSKSKRQGTPHTVTRPKVDTSQFRLLSSKRSQPLTKMRKSMVKMREGSTVTLKNDVNNAVNDKTSISNSILGLASAYASDDDE
eukprot:m.97666 g.97666  ORF g.97666 m.97666 type:complete len:346 (+) comp26999_c0_seq1:195-1232(+)